MIKTNNTVVCSVSLLRICVRAVCVYECERVTRMNCAKLEMHQFVCVYTNNRQPAKKPAKTVTSRGNAGKKVALVGQCMQLFTVLSCPSERGVCACM